MFKMSVGAIVAMCLLAGQAAATKVPLPKPKPNLSTKVADEQPRLLACPKKERVGGSCPNVIRAYRISQENNYTPLKDKEQVEKFIKAGILREVRGTDTLTLRGVAHPYARPALFTFLERFSKQYFDKCKEPLVVTSLARSEDKQPRNASKYSVHPMGMAADLSVARNTCHAWIEKTLLALEGRGVLDITRERRPAHYHVVIYPKQYMGFIK